MRSNSQQQRQKQEGGRSTFGGRIHTTVRTRHWLWAVALITVVGVGVVWRHVAWEKRITLQPGQSQLMRTVGHQLQRHHTQGFLRWDITETSLPAGRKWWEGVVRWNASSGAAHESVAGMPVVLYHANPVQRTLTPIAYTVTTYQGQFVIEGDATLPTLIGGLLHRARNIPVKVRTVLERHNPPVPEGVSTDGRYR